MLDTEQNKQYVEGRSNTLISPLMATRYGTQSTNRFSAGCEALLLTSMRFDSSLVTTIRVIDLKLMRSYDLVVQLVRISACHAEGREFESRLDRK